LERGISHAASRELTHWEGYLRGWRAMIHLDQGRWAEAEEEIDRILGRAYGSGVYRFPALVALSRLRLRRGDPDVETPLDEVRSLCATLAELQRSVYFAVLLAERAWLGNAGDSKGELKTAIAHLRDAQTQALAQGALWVTEETSLWLHHLGEASEGAAMFATPAREHCEGRWQPAADGWAALGKPYEEAMALGEGDEAAQRRALEIFDRLTAAPAAAGLRRRMRAQGVRTIPRGPIAGTRASPAGLTRRQAQVLILVEEGLSNLEIADRLCISAKTAEHHVSAIIARLGVTGRREVGNAARSLGGATASEK
jgi:DNA-binding CsgD family transcriptional regulator